MRLSPVMERIFQALFSNRSLYEQDEMNNSSPDKSSPEDRRRYAEQCALDNRNPLLLMAWLALAMVCIMLFFYFLQPYMVDDIPFYPYYIYLYIFMAIFCPIFLLLLYRMRRSPKRLIPLELSFFAVVSLWSAAFSAMDAVNGFSSYLFVQIIVIQALLYRGYPKWRCITSGVGYLLYIGILLRSGMGVTRLFVETINPFFMTVIACAIILMNDRIQYKAFCNRELIREQHTMLEYYANNDYLTAISNRKRISECLDKLLSFKGNLVLCMMLDIDNFKVYNDIHGHIMGDDCLIQTASAIEEVVTRHGGQVGRYGGEEFLALFDGLGEEKGMVVAQEIVKAVENQRIPFNSSQGDVVTVSVGVAVARAGDMEPCVLVDRADRALYCAKSQGRNRAHLFKPCE